MAVKLTPDQYRAVTNRGGKLLVSAAAGSGKTKVLVDRLMSYIMNREDPANIDDFLIITYTKAAASELRGKITAKLSELIAENPGNRHLQQQMQRLYLAKISTVHGFCSDILRQYTYRLDIASDFRVADERECFDLQMKALEQILDSAYETAAEHPDFLAFVDSQGIGRDDRSVPEIVLKVYHSAMCHKDPDRWLEWCITSSENEVTDAGQTPWGSYLMNDLKQYLSMQIDAMSVCAAKASVTPEMEKPAKLFEQIVNQLKTLYASNTWDEIVRNKEIDYGRLLFSKKCTDLALAEKMKAIRTACKDGLAKRLRSFADDSNQILEDLSASSAAARGLVWLVRRFNENYTRLKRGRGILDFGDLEHYTLDLLLGKTRSGPTAIADEIGQRFREVMVDEYQDSNDIQDGICGALTFKRQNCFMVGDVKQSIYQFRLADPSIFIEKYNTYKPADTAQAGEGRKVLLSSNFRSSAGVICAVNDVFSQCMSPSVGGISYGPEEMLKEGIPHVDIGEAEVSLYGIEVDQDTYSEEAQFVANTITKLLDGNHMVREGDQLRAIIPDDIVILLRSPGSVGRDFQHALQDRGIRCVTGESSNLLHTEEIAAVRSILQIINNPLQDIPLAAAMVSPVFGFTADDLAALRSKDPFRSLYSLVSMSDDPKSKYLINMLDQFRSEAGFSTVTQLVSSIYSKTRLLSIYSASQEGTVKLDNLQTFYQIVSDFESTGPKELSRLLDFLDAADERGFEKACSANETGAVTIMSIHKSKGLEFPVVFLCGLSRGFNQESARGQVLCDKDLGLGLSCYDSRKRLRYPTLAKRAISVKTLREGLSEELRVLYVAMTRARDRLVMTHAVRNLTDELRCMAMRLDMSSPQLIAADADCPGAWVLQSALKRTEAGAFFDLGGHPDCAAVQEIPWDIRVVSVSGASYVSHMEDTPVQQIPQDVLSRLSANLSFRYAYNGATRIPSKLTATQLKGRYIDTEVTNGIAASNASVSFRKPGMKHSISGSEYGNAMHAVLQYIRFEECGSIDRIQSELKRMVGERLISQDQADSVNCEHLTEFFKSSIGKRVLQCKNTIREFKFSLLGDAAQYYPDTEGEQLLIQGVVDCALLETDGITVIDFKTDRVTDESVLLAAEKYRQQVLLYAGALERIYKLPIKSAALYFFAVNKVIEIM